LSNKEYSQQDEAGFLNKTSAYFAANRYGTRDKKVLFFYFCWTASVFWM
jgi:hypothetical protein